MTADLEAELVGDGGALNEANKTILEGKEKLTTSIDDITEQVSCERIITKRLLPMWYRKNDSNYRCVSINTTLFKLKQFFNFSGTA